MKVEDENIRRRVRDSVQRLLFSRGVKGWNTDMLAAECGLAKNTLYKIIGSKERIIEEVILAQVRENAESIIAFGTENLDLSSREALIRVLREAIRRFAGNMSRFEPVVLPQVYREYPAIEPKVNALVQELSTMAHAYFDMGLKAGLIRPGVDPEAWMDVARGMVDHYIKKGTDKAVFEDRMVKIFDYMLTGILA